MRILRRGREFLARRLVWQLVFVFVAGALVPLALSDWLATSVIADVARSLNHDRGAAATRNASRQVFDRLMLAKALLRAVADAPPRPEGAPPPGSALDEASPFAALACLDPAGNASAGPGTASAIAELWRASEPTKAGRAARGVRPFDQAGIELRVVAAPGRAARLFLGTGAGTGGTCAAELSPAYFWQPLQDAGNDGAWTVRDEDGRILVATRGVELEGGVSRPDRFKAHLFLTSEFNTQSWIFDQEVRSPSVEWHGLPIGTWLACVALCTILSIGLIGQWRIRRILAPLEQLTEGSRRLASGSTPALVDIRSDDEVGELSNAFNEMSTQLAARMASLRGLAEIDSGILRGVPLPELAQGALRHLTLIHPGVALAIAWRLGNGRFSVIRSGASSEAGAARVEELFLGPEEIGKFEAIADGTRAAADIAGPAHPAFARLFAETGDAGNPGAELHFLVVKDGLRNQALISLAPRSSLARVDLQQCIDLRERLAVAIVARDREDELVHRAAHDELTGLKNSYGLKQDLDALLAREQSLAVLFVDLDHFKDVNDRYGHATGDRLLQAAAERLRDLVPARSLLSRNGGDEFVIVIPRGDAAAAGELATWIIAELGRPFILSSTEHLCGASIGIATCPEHGLDRDELLRCADIALYQSKSLGRARSTLFTPRFDAALREKGALLEGLHKALLRSEFIVHYQPRLNVADGAITSAEALVRWQHPERGLTLPGVFIELAESSGLIDAIGLFVLDTAIAQVGQWKRDGLSIERVSVNVSQRQFAAGELVGNVRALLDRHGVSGRHLELEVTESLLSGDISAVKSQLDEMRAMGVSIALDDFGTGYSSMSRLRELPIDVMKIDRAFVMDLETGTNAVAIARSIVTLAKTLDLRIVAEGIETSAQAAILAEMGCDEFQGFLFSKGVPAQRLSELNEIDLREPAVAGWPRSGS